MVKPEGTFVAPGLKGGRLSDNTSARSRQSRSKTKVKADSLTGNQVWIVVDAEANGPAPGLFSMTSIGAIVVDDALDKTFGAGLINLPDAKIDPIAAQIDNFEGSREDPEVVMNRFVSWLDSFGPKRKIFWSDNPSFDFGFVNWYLWKFVGRNPFGWSGRRIGDLYCGMVGNTSATWKNLRRTTHDHDPRSDAKGNAEALIKILKMMKGER